MKPTITLLIFLLLAQSSVFSAETAPHVAMNAKHKALLQEHCVKCHGPEKHSGNFRVDDLSFEITSIETAEKWQKVLNQMNSGEMPPEDEQQPPTAAKTDFLDDLANVMVAARRSLNDQHGVITMRRLNRREYKNTLRELLGVEINVSELPSDTGTGGFDTSGQNLFMSANQFEQYQSLGRAALEEAFAWRAAAGEERSLRYEAEDSLKVITKNYNEQLDALERAKQWAQAVDDAAARPENAQVVAQLRTESKNDDTFRRSWAMIKGAPAPEEFGFKTVENNADRANRALGYGTPVGIGYMRPYHERYLKMPHLDTGAYLTIMAGDLGNDAFRLTVPHNWPVGDYTVRVHAGVIEDTPAERRFFEFGTHPRNGRVLSTHEVTGSIAQPQVIEIPLTLTKEHSDTSNRTIFIRERGTADHYTQTRRVFGEGKSKNGIGPELAIWVDWIEIERKTDTAKPAAVAEAKFNVGSNRQVGSVSAKGLNKVRYECEQANGKVNDYVAYTIDGRERAQKWVAEVEAAAAKPENAEIVAKLKKESKSDAIFRRSWETIPGAPNPRTFGFDKKGENDADMANSSLGENWQKYHEYYLSRPALDRGAYLGTPTMHPAVMALGFLQLPVPGEWTSGEFIMRVRIAATEDARPEQKFLEAGMHPRNGMVRATFEITGTMEQPQVVEMPFTLTRSQTDSGDRTLFIREKGAWDNNEEGGRKRGEAVKRNGIGPEAVLWIDYIEIERVSIAAKPQPPALAALGFVPDDQAPPPPATEAHAAIARFAKVAFRGTEAPESFRQQLAGIYDTLIKSGSKPGAAMKDTLSVVLASPMFLYLAEPAADGKRRTLNRAELATRLAYFLWSAPPDEELLQADLTKPDVLAAHTNRLLADPRSRDFVNGFVFQWLGMDRLDFFEVNRPKFPRFDDSTRLAAKNEVYETFAYILQHNAPLSDLLKSDYIITNHLLAEFYGIEGVHGDAFQKVSLPQDSPRGGLLGMAAVNVMGGNGDHTSPVERGAWVLRKLLNDPPPPAPANVPQIARLAGKVLTTRERLAAHQEDAQCASCHRKIDPIGFGLENFDAVGQWRTEDTYQVMDETGKPVKGASKTWQIEVNGTLHKGPSFQDYFQLRDIIAAESDAFANGFSEALIEYALGRSVGFRDETLINGMTLAAQKEKLGMRAFIHALVASEEFQTK
jgi:mono/diheme cytochrome c family protein